MATLIRAASLEGNNLKEVTRGKMLVRARGPGPLAEAARPLGYTTGAAVCSVISINENSGQVEGAQFSLLGEEGVTAVEMAVAGKKIWQSASRTLEVNIKISLNTLSFSGANSDKKGFRCCSEFVDFQDCDGVTVTDGGEVVDKSNWKDKEGLSKGGCLRVFLEPESATHTRFKIVCVPIAKEKLLHDCQESDVDPEDPQIPVIALSKNLKMRLFPAEPEPATSGMGILPFLFCNAVEFPGELPSTPEIKAAHFSLMRDVVRPVVYKAAEWEAAWIATDWEAPGLPALLWPEPPTAAGGGAQGE